MRRHWAFFALFALFFATNSWAQATRTWVSGVGDDANPCSRTAPCKTFAGAISKTAAGGEINALDPGGFGGVTITKSISIIAEGVEAGVLVSGTNAIVVNAGAGDRIVLRGLDIEGLGTGLNGIRFLAGGTLHVERCTINSFTQAGISFVPSGASRLYVQDSIVRNNNPTGGGSFAGIFLNPAVGGSAEASLDGVVLLRNFHGLRLLGNARATARNCTASGHGGTGFLVAPNGQLNLDGCEASNNANGVRADGAGAVARLANAIVTNNTNGLLAASGGAIQSFGNNRIAGNATNGAPTSTIGEQ
jgi:hypothetical protein